MNSIKNPSFMLPCESKLDRVLSISHPCHPPQPASMPEDRMLPICSPAMLIIAHTQQMQPLRPAENETGKRREKSRGFVRCWCFVGLYDVLWCHMVFYGVIWGCMLLYVVICCYMLLYDVEWCDMKMYLMLNPELSSLLKGNLQNLVPNVWKVY